ncbi:hypothetical protein CBL_13405 [Carabus blaptoides fortunei]
MGSICNFLRNAFDWKRGRSGAYIYASDTDAAVRTATAMPGDRGPTNDSLTVNFRARAHVLVQQTSQEESHVERHSENDACHGQTSWLEDDAARRDANTGERSQELNRNQPPAASELVFSQRNTPNMSLLLVDLTFPARSHHVHSTRRTLNLFGLLDTHLWNIVKVQVSSRSLKDYSRLDRRVLPYFNLTRSLTVMLQ